ncbi:MAG: cysteine hydrolase [Desulfarculus sp.]|jgi:nicotinamidase-related amidase|nr:MAG: cysteine hydrolase [Desulfarculus sp.]
MSTVEIVDRSEMVDTLKSRLRIAPSTTAIVAVDMHRGHLDPAIATMPATPEDCASVIKHTKNLLDFARGAGIPVIHVILIQRNIPGLGAEGLNLKFWKALHEIANAENRLTPGRKSTAADHNLVGSPGTEIIPELLHPSDHVINNKKRLDCFYGTDLEILLRVLKTETVVLTGINTNTCVLNTAFTACNRDFQVVVISDCVASMYGRDLHVLGLENVKRCLGYVLTVEEFKNKIRGAQG